MRGGGVTLGRGGEGGGAPALGGGEGGNRQPQMVDVTRQEPLRREMVYGREEPAARTRPLLQYDDGTALEYEGASTEYGCIHSSDSRAKSEGNGG